MSLGRLVVTSLLAAATATGAELLFSRPIDRVLARLVSEELATLWRRYVLVAIHVVVRGFELERPGTGQPPSAGKAA